MLISLFQALSLLPDGESYVCFSTNNPKRKARRMNATLEEIVTALEKQEVHLLVKRQGAGYCIRLGLLLIKTDLKKTKAYLKTCKWKFKPRKRKAA
jgi:hypothetical protein